MLLSEIEQQTIKESVSAFDKQAKIVLFGSRVRDAARGGDIDLLLSTSQLTDTFARIAFGQGEML